MGTTTSNLQLYKPAAGETGWGTLVDGNFDTLDELVTAGGRRGIVTSFYSLTHMDTFHESSHANKIQAMIDRHVDWGLDIRTYLRTVEDRASAFQLSFQPRASGLEVLTPAEVIAGDGDAVIVAAADDLRHARVPVVLRFMWEMNLTPAIWCAIDGNGDDRADHSNAEYIAAWQRVRTIFRGPNLAAVNNMLGKLGQTAVTTAIGMKNDVQMIYETGTPTGGTFKLVVGSAVTGNLNHNADAGTIQTALEGLASVGTGNVACADNFSDNGQTKVTFQGGLAGQPMPQMYAISSLTGGTDSKISVVKITEGRNGDSTYLNSPDSACGAPNVLFCWSPNLDADVVVSGKNTNLAEEYYPGDDYVDIIGLSFYDWESGPNFQEGWDTYRRPLLDDHYNAHPNKPFCLPEWGIRFGEQNDPGYGDNYQFVNATFEWMKERPRVLYESWWEGGSGDNTSHLDDPNRTLTKAAFQAQIADPVFLSRWPTPSPF